MQFYQNRREIEDFILFSESRLVLKYNFFLIVPIEEFFNKYCTTFIPRCQPKDRANHSMTGVRATWKEKSLWSLYLIMTNFRHDSCFEKTLPNSYGLQIGNAACVLGNVSDKDAFEEI